MYVVLLLTLSWRRSPSYRNQSFDLHWKLIDWFLYDRDLHHERFNISFSFVLCFVICRLLMAAYMLDISSNVCSNCRVGKFYLELLFCLEFELNLTWIRVSFMHVLILATLISLKIVKLYVYLRMADQLKIFQKYVLFTYNWCRTEKMLVNV